MYARSARKEAETLLEQRSRALYDANFELSTVAAQLEKIVEWRMAQLSEALLKAEMAAKAKSEFLAVMSHEIRTRSMACWAWPSCCPIAS
jgi:signal transduction histidine kinase